ncbi:MAG: hypothetical protein ACR2NI_03060 [Pirellulales bacterium]
MAYNFRDKDVAYELKRIANESMGQVSQPYQPSGNEVIIVKAPTAGIVAISGTEITSGECTRMFVNTQPTQVDITEDTSFTVEVFNTTGEDIVGDTYFQAARCGTAWVSVAGGGGGGGSPNYLCKAPVGGVPARTGDTASQTDCDTYEINTQSGLISSTGSTVNIYNIWSQGVASSAYFTAKQIDGVYVPDAEDCTGN